MAQVPRTLKLVLAYDGTRYAGWQRQANADTIQARLETALARLAGGEPVVVHGAGRTDAGVHALAMVAHCRFPRPIPCQGIQRGLNSLLPPDIRILAVQEVDSGFHARYSARAKHYRYQFTDGPVVLPTQRLYWVGVRGPLDPAAMTACLDLVVGTHDFSSFEGAGSRTGDERRGAVRTIFSARLATPAAHHYQLEICGDGFLRHMVRNIAGTVIQVGQGRRTVGEFGGILAGRDRRLAGPTAPAHGLFLVAVDYDEDTTAEDAPAVPDPGRPAGNTTSGPGRDAGPGADEEVAQ